MMGDLIKRDDALRIVEEYDVLHDHIKALPAIDHAAIREAALNTKLAECEARLGKAMEVLRPFAKAADTWEPDDGDSALGARIEHPHHGLERHAEFTFGDLRFARKVLAELEGKE